MFPLPIIVAIMASNNMRRQQEEDEIEDDRHQKYMDDYEKKNNLYRHYYSYRYAVPQKFKIIKFLIQLLSWVIGLLGMGIMFSLLFDMESTYSNLWIIPIKLIGGAVVLTASLLFYNKFVIDDNKCKDNVYIRVDESFPTEKDWDDAIKKLNIPTNYILTKVEDNWEYKHFDK